MEIKIGEYTFTKNEKVKIDVDKILSGQLKRSAAFISFLTENVNTIFTVKSVTKEIVALNETNFTFWRGHLVPISQVN